MSTKNSDSTDAPQDDQPEAKAKRVSPTKPSDMSQDMIEFITAIDEYKRVHQRPFPSLGEIFEVMKSLGYARPAA